jgi:hypothetical protein
MQAGAPNYLPFLVFVPVIVWRVYSRIRRNVGRQTLGKWRPWVTMTLFPVIIILLSLGALSHPLRLLAMAGGILAGAALGVFGTKHTKFENTPQGIFYTPNVHIGLALSVVLVGRVVYRLSQLYTLDPNMQPSAQDFSGSALTLAIFGLIAGYYVTYAIGLVRYKARVECSAMPPAATP